MGAKIVTDDEIREYALTQIKTNKDELYLGASAYRVAVKDSQITATLHGGFHDSCPFDFDFQKWKSIAQEELEKYGTVIKVDGSGRSFFLCDEHDKPLFNNVKVYDVPSAYGGLHTNYEIILD